MNLGRDLQNNMLLLQVKVSVVQIGLCISHVGAFVGSCGIYPTGENINDSFVTYVTK
jgi:hypothetical protein